MTSKEPDNEPGRLERLYREQADIEPGPGIDQQIRARARDEARPARLPRPAQWLGGVAVAASLFVVVAVVTDLRSPGPELPGEDRGTPADSAPAARAGRAESSAFSTGQPIDGKSQLDLRSRREPAAPQAAQLSSGQAESAVKPSPHNELDEGLGPIPRPRLDQMQERSRDVDQALWLIERLISTGNAERARAEVERLRELHPGQEIPPDLLKQLEELEADNSSRE